MQSAAVLPNVAAGASALMLLFESDISMSLSYFPLFESTKVIAFTSIGYIVQQHVSFIFIFVLNVFLNGNFAPTEFL